MEVASPPRRVLYVVTKANWGGAQRYVHDLAIAAAAAGHAVAVAYGEPGALVERLTKAGIRTLAVPAMRNEASLSAFRSARAALSTLFRTERPDVVHLNSSLAGAAGAFAARQAGVARVIFTAHGWAFNERRPLPVRVVFWLLQYLTVLRSHLTICVSRAVNRDARLMLGTGEKRIIIHNGIEPPHFLERDAARATLLPDAASEAWIGTIAELHPTKRLDMLIRAVAKLPEARLIVIGEGAARPLLEALIQELACGDRVTLAGHRPDAARYLRAFDVFALPSRSEGLGYVLLEAGAAGLPVAASNVGGIPEIIEDGTTGLLVPAGDAAALEAALALLLGDPARAARLGAALARKIAREFSLTEMVRATLARY